MQSAGKKGSGRLMMMACPMLEDEMIYNLTTDPDEKRIFLLANKNTETLLPKLKANNVQFEQISEDDFFNENADVPREGYNIIIWMMSLGLHSEPANLASEIRRLILTVPGHADGIALYYGLCGRGLEGIREWGSENLPIPLTLFTDKEGKLCDDCICVPLGSSENYLNLMKKHYGVLYLTPAVACSWREFLDHTEMFKGLDSIDMSRKEYMKLMLNMAQVQAVPEDPDQSGRSGALSRKVRRVCQRVGVGTDRARKWVGIHRGRGPHVCRGKILPPGMMVIDRNANFTVP